MSDLKVRELAILEYDAGVKARKEAIIQRLARIQDLNDEIILLTGDLIAEMVAARGSNQNIKALDVTADRVATSICRHARELTNKLMTT
jgi:hypothetical protein